MNDRRLAEVKRVTSTISAIGASITFATAVVAAPAPDAALVESAIAAEARAADRVVINERLAEARVRLAEQIKRNPTEQIGGVIVFATGLDSRQVARFVEQYPLEVTRAEAKVAVQDSTVTETMSFGAQSLFFLDGSLDERLEKLVGHQRGEFMAQANAARDASQAAAFREAAYSREIRFYKIEAVGPASSFDRIQKGTEAAALFIDGSKARVEELSAARATAARMRGTGVVIKGRPYADGPPPGVRVTPGPSLINPTPVAPPDPSSQQPQRLQR
jgi:hypothetical protein